MKNYIALFCLIILFGCHSNKNNQENSNLFYVGTYTDGESQGIYKCVLQADGSLDRIGLVAKTDNPSFLAKSADNKFLVAVNEINK